MRDLVKGMSDAFVEKNHHVLVVTQRVIDNLLVNKKVQKVEHDVKEIRIYIWD